MKHFIGFLLLSYIVTAMAFVFLYAMGLEIPSRQTIEEVIK